MKIQHKIRNKQVNLTDIKIGECFINPADDALYMRLYEENNGPIIDVKVVRLDSALVYDLPAKQEVLTVDVSITIHEGYTDR
jgi:hypothetical protein